MVDYDNEVGWASLLIPRIHQQVAQESKIQWLPATLHSTGWMDHHQYMMEVLRPFRNWTLWLLKWHTVTLPHVISVYNDMLDHLDGVMRVLAKKKTHWKEDFYFTMKDGWQQLSKYYTEVTSMARLLSISAHIIDSSWKLRSFRKWDKGMYINPQDETSYTDQYYEAFRNFVQNECFAKHWRMSVIKPDNVLHCNIFSCAKD